MSLKLLVADVLVDGSLTDGLDVALNVLDPLPGVVLSLLVYLGVLGVSLLPDLLLPGDSPLLIYLLVLLSQQSGVGVKLVQGLVVG